MKSAYSAAFSAGTLQNRSRQAKAYLSFMIFYNFDYLNPTPITLLLYIQFLANTHKNITSIKNYLSGAKTFVVAAGGQPWAFSTPFIPNLYKGLLRMSTHTPMPAPAIPIHTIKVMCDILAAMSTDGPTVQCAVLIAFASFLRQSNLLPTYGPGAIHALRRQDVCNDGTCLWLSINSSKTRVDPRMRVSIPVPAVPGRHCPVLAWRDYIRRVPLAPDAPAFMLSATVPLLPARMNFYMRTGLQAIKSPLAQFVTVHSLRRSGAQECARLVASQEQLMRHGTWASQAINAYVPKRLYSTIPSFISTLFGR